MGKGTLTIYSASAGSGKTYTLTGIYLKNLFRSRYSYRKILAVTFTNKATAEMKSRILENLHKLSAGEHSEYLRELIAGTNKSEAWLRSEAGEILNAILHDFSRFSVSTIDSFFQRILRSFAREAGLNTGFNIELDHSAILSASIDNMIESAGNDMQLKNWLITYALSNLEEDKSWNLKDGITKLASELFKERFKILSEKERSNLADKVFLNEYIKLIRNVATSFEKKLTEYGTLALTLFTTFDLTDDMFYRKGQGIPRFVRSIAAGTVISPNSYIREVLNDPPRWTTGKTDPFLQDALANGLEGIITEALRYYDDNICAYNSTKAVLSNIFALGILSDVLFNVHKITTTENSFLLSDAGDLINQITKGDQSPFIYEKVGNKYENFMIDEFQDTSIIQWNNFRPLIDNSMAEGSDNLVVGDVKQSIYRWRNSDWQILGQTLKSKIDNERYFSNPLTTNWRSHSNIIRFNNALFTVIPAIIDQTLADDGLPVSFREVYSEAIQSDPGNNQGGYVRVEFIENEKEKIWQEKVMERLPSVIESFQDKGYSASDIGIIVRDGREGAMVLKTLIDYSNNQVDKTISRYNYNVVSNDSLLLANSPAINFIVSVLAVVNDKSDLISRAMMLRYFLLAKGDDKAEEAPIVSSKLIANSRAYFPEGYESFLDSVKEMPLFEAVESIIHFFDLGSFRWNVAYLNTFQDYVVSFTGNRNSDILSFLEWWNETGIKKSVVLPGNQDAIRILTIHKSKGLEFKVVILPFLSWNLDHITSKQPFLWVNPSVPPFNKLGIIPVRYSRELLNTFFADSYREEKYSVYLDNINLLYVAFTRAREAIYGFSVSNPRSENTIATVLKNALAAGNGFPESGEFRLKDFFITEKSFFSYGEIVANRKEKTVSRNFVSSDYHVSAAVESLKLKLHGENYFSSGNEALRKKINYGKLMHEVFEEINTPSDIPFAVRKLVLEGKLPEAEYGEIEKKVTALLGLPQVSDWFDPGNEVMREAGILLTSGNIRRPDRVIFRNGKTIIIDFKFGEENSKYIEQVNMYKSLLGEMGYADIEAFIWYVDKNKIVSA